MKIEKCETVMTCNMCDASMTAYNVNGTYIYVCDDSCPNVQFEYVEPKDLENLNHFLEDRNV